MTPCTNRWRWQASFCTYQVLKHQEINKQKDTIMLWTQRSHVLKSAIFFGTDDSINLSRKETITLIYKIVNCTKCGMQASNCSIQTHIMMTWNGCIWQMKGLCGGTQILRHTTSMEFVCWRKTYMYLFQHLLQIHNFSIVCQHKLFCQALNLT